MEERRPNMGENNDCCCKSEHHYFEENQCKEKCCEPKEIKCSPHSIDRAKCIPILTDRIFDCKRVHHEQVAYLPNVKFYIISDCKYEDGAKICIEKVSTEYDFIGLQTIPQVIVDNNKSDKFIPSLNSGSHTCKDTNTGEKFNIYNSFTGYITTSDGDCCKEGVSKKIVEQNLEFYVCNLRIAVKGTIGCKEFKAITKPYSGSLVKAGFKLADFYGRLCFPQGRNSVTIDEIFESCISADCVSALSEYNCDCPECFRASIVASFASEKTVSELVKEKLIVFATPHGLYCDNGDIMSHCRPEHKPEHKPEYKPECRPEHKPEYKPEYKPECKPNYKSDYKTDYKSCE